MSTDPTPLLQDPSAPASLRQALHEAHDGDVPPELLARLLEQAALPPPPPPPSAAWVPWLKWIVPLASVALLGLGVLLRRPSPPLVSSALATASSSAPSSAVAPVAPADDPVPPEVTPSAPAPSAPRPPPAPSAPRGPDEATLLEQARASLATNPTRTLALTREHARRFPRGLLAQEREVLAVEALRRVGKPGEASSRGDAFRMENPDSAYVPRVTASSQGR